MAYLADSLHGFKVNTEIGELIIEGLSEVIENVPEFLAVNSTGPCSNPEWFAVPP